MYADFSNADREIIDVFFQVEYPWKNALLQQLNNAKHVTESYENAYYIKFTVTASCCPINNVSRVPLTVLIECGSKNEIAEIYYDDTCVSFTNVHPSPIGCKIHIVNGYLNEIEVFTLDGTFLNLENMSKGKKYYLFHS